MTLLVLFVGVVLGAGLTLWWLHRWSLSDEGQRLVARSQAEQRIRDVETRALHAMATAAEQAVHGAAAPAGWPSSDRTVDGTAVEITAREV
ncbi:MAG: hypothetical protein ITG02_00855 [Patulibacter sp.]|nr:hypothetical protein [Patulibacter sp.]